MTSKTPIERLLIYADNHLYERGGSNTLWEDVMDIADEIEAQYMRLPVDADGVPIRIGDEIEYPNGRRDVVRFITINDNSPTFNESGWIASKCRHVQPDTVESLLQELADEVWEASCKSQTTWSDSGLDGIAERYAERIRKAVQDEN